MTNVIQPPETQMMMMFIFPKFRKKADSDVRDMFLSIAYSHIK